MDYSILKDLITLLEGLLTYPYPNICRHFVAGELLSIFEKHNIPVTNELAKAVVQCDDDKALEHLNKLKLEVNIDQH